MALLNCAERVEKTNNRPDAIEERQNAVRESDIKFFVVLSAQDDVETIKEFAFFG